MKRIIAAAFIAGLYTFATAQAQTTSPVQTTINQIEGVLNQVISAASQFTQADLALAISDANANNNTAAATCWKNISGLNLLTIPQGAGLAYFKQRVLDLEASYVTINQTCGPIAPAFVKVYDTLVQQVAALNL